MSTQFLPIVAPPQTLDSLDAWGSVDTFPISLDDPRAVAAGIYGVSIADTGATSQELSTLNLVVVLYAPTLAEAWESIQVNNVYSILCSGDAISGGSARLNADVQPDAVAIGHAESETVFNLVFDAKLEDTAQSTEKLVLGVHKALFLRPVNSIGYADGFLSGYEVLKSLGELDGYGVAQGVATVSATSALGVDGVRGASGENALSLSCIAPISCFGEAITAENILFLVRVVDAVMESRAQSGGACTVAPKYGTGWEVIPQTESVWSPANG